MSATSNKQPVAVVTGASRGLGKSLAMHFIDRGYMVAGCSRGSGTISHESYRHDCVDVSQENDVRSWIRNVRTTFGCIDLLICNAGLVRSALMLSMTPADEMESIVRTNYIGAFYVLREVSKIMALHGSGRIITISSTMTLLHEEGTSIYSATKAALTETTKVLAKELAPRGVTCNVIAPGMMWTGSSESLSRGGDWQNRMLSKQIFPRIIEMDEICHVADFFASDKSGGITGQVIYIGMVS